MQAQPGVAVPGCGRRWPRKTPAPRTGRGLDARALHAWNKQKGPPRQNGDALFIYLVGRRQSNQVKKYKLIQ